MRNRLSLSLAAAGVTLLASASAAQAQSIDKVFPKAVESNGTARSVAASDGTAAWLSQEKRPGTGGDFSLHILQSGKTEATKIAVESDAFLSELSIDSDDDETTVVAVARKNKNAPGDIVSIDATSGAVTKVEGAANAKADERAPALADGTLSFAVKTSKKAKTQIKQVPLDGGKATTFATLTAKTLVADLATYPDGKKLGLSSATALNKKKVRLAIATVTKGGKPKAIKAQTIGPKDTYGIGGPYVTEEGETLFATGSVGVSLYRAGESKPVRKISFYDDAAWVGGDLGLLAIVPVDEGSNLRGTGPIE